MGGLVPQPVLPDTPLVRCRRCPRIFTSATSSDLAFVHAHESTCAGPAPPTTPLGCACAVPGLAPCPLHPPIGAKDIGAKPPKPAA